MVRSVWKHWLTLLRDYTEAQSAKRLPTDLKRTYHWIADAYLAPDAVLADMFDLLNGMKSEERLAKLAIQVQMGKTLELLVGPLIGPLEQTSLQVELDDLVNSMQILAYYWYEDRKALARTLQSSLNSADEVSNVLSNSIARWIITAEEVTGSASVYTAPIIATTALPSSIDLRPECPPVYDESQLSGVVSNAMAAALEFCLMKQKLFPVFTPSRLFMYYNERAIEGTINSDSGSQINDGVKSVETLGVCPEDMWPYDIAKFAERPPDACYQTALQYRIFAFKRVRRNLAQLKKCLASGYPFIFGFSTYENFSSQQVTETGYVPMPQPGEQVIGGHAALAVGYDDANQWFIVRNSFGKHWGIQGYFTLPYAFFTNPKLSSDFWTVRIKEATETPPSSIDLRSACPPVYVQDQLGSVVGTVIAAALEFCLMKQKLFPVFTPSRLFIYYNARAIEGTINSDSGSQINDGVKSVETLGVCPEDMWPYDIAKFAERPPDACYQTALQYRIFAFKRVRRNLAQLKKCLASGYPFIFGFTVYESFQSQEVSKTGHASMPQPGEQVIGGHAALAVGYDDANQWFIVRNSWGADWGIQGYFTLPYAYFTNPKLCSGFWTARIKEETKIPQKTKDQWLEEGNAHYGFKRYEEALAAYEKALLLDPIFAESWKGKGWTLYRLKRYEEALAAFEQSIRLDPDSADSWDGRVGPSIVSSGMRRHLQPLSKFCFSILIPIIPGTPGTVGDGPSIVSSGMRRHLQPLSRAFALIPIPLTPGMGRPKLSASFKDNKKLSMLTKSSSTQKQIIGRLCCKKSERNAGGVQSLFPVQLREPLQTAGR